MAKYVLLAFDDDKEADQFVEDMSQGNIMAWVRGVREGFTVKALVRGVWKKPTKFCEHKSASGPFTRGKKYGWWVHAVPGCGRPTEAWANGDHWFQTLGVNLLPISKDAPDYRGPGQINHPGYQPKANWCPQEGRFHFKAEPGSVCPNCRNITLTVAPIHQKQGDSAEPANSTDPTGAGGS